MILRSTLVVKVSILSLSVARSLLRNKIITVLKEIKHVFGLQAEEELNEVLYTLIFFRFIRKQLIFETRKSEGIISKIKEGARLFFGNFQNIIKC